MKKTRSASIQNLIDETIEILRMVGVSVEKMTKRSAERAAMVLLAVAGVQGNWDRGLNRNRKIKTREIINYINQNFEENISSGSYDNIRRKDLRPLIMAGIVESNADNPQAATNDPTRGYSLTSEMIELMVTYGTANWHLSAQKFLGYKNSLNNQNTYEIPVNLPSSITIELSSGEHNRLQRHIIEDFLPRYGFGAEVLYIGDTKNKFLYLQQSQLSSLGFPIISHEKLPDIIAYSSTKNWLYIIEAVHSSGAINELRIAELQSMAKHSTAGVVFVTAFLTRKDFKKWAADIAWETEVWIAEYPDHLIHFDGKIFIGPHTTAASTDQRS